jgi:pyruvate formate lyase activating enzyme
MNSRKCYNLLMKAAILYEKFSNQSVRCLACRHYCKISEGKTGLCGVRQNISGELQLLVYGEVTEATIDPIEKKPLFHFLPGSKIFSIGTVGCNFGCEFCQNWVTSQASRELRKKSADNIPDLHREISKMGFKITPEQIVKYCLEKNIPSIAYTYNEPAIFFEFTYDTAKLAHKNGLKNVYVSNGYASKESVDKISPYLDAINIDLKSFSEEFYTKTCKAHLQPVLDSIRYYQKKKIWIEITTLVIPGKNDSEKELKQIAEFIASVSLEMPWHISRFAPRYKMENLPETNLKKLETAYKIGKEAGLKYIYMGNVDDEKYSTTYCPKCGEALITRGWNEVKENRLIDGKCWKCGERIEGVYSTMGHDPLLNIERTRKPKFAGLFYDSDPERLRKQIENCLAEADLSDIDFDPRKIKAAIVPHAGYIFSGPTAAYVYKVIGQSKKEQFVILGLSHQQYFSGIAKSGFKFWETPLGHIEVSKDLDKSFDVPILEEAHSDEHSVEVQLPFLQTVSPDAKILPMVTSEIFDYVETAEIFQKSLTGDTILIVSSDLSHYNSYEEAMRIDKNTLRKIQSFGPEIKPDEACGFAGINLLMMLAEQKGWKLHLLDYRNSGDTAGDKDQVVGYGGMVFVGK